MVHFCFNLHIKPIEDKTDHYYELFDDTTILLCIYHIYLFTDFVTNADDRNTFGWSLVGIMAINVGYRVSIALYTMVMNGINTCKVAYNYCKNKKAAKKEKVTDLTK